MIFIAAENQYPKINLLAGILPQHKKTPDGQHSFY
jgi:hypothetical protein